MSKDNIKFIGNLFFYILIGFFYRKDIRITFYRKDVTNKIPLIYLNYGDYKSEDFLKAILRITENSKSSFKDKLNCQRILFGLSLNSSKSLLLKRIKCTFLSDVFLGRKEDKVYRNDKYNYFYFILRIIKYTTDYSNHREVFLE